MKLIRYPIITPDIQQQYTTYDEDNSQRRRIFQFDEEAVKADLLNHLKRVPTDDENDDATDAAWAKINACNPTLFTMAEGDPWWWIILINEHNVEGIFYLYTAIKTMEVFDHTAVTDEIVLELLAYDQHAKGMDPEEPALVTLFSSRVVKKQESRPVLIAVTRSFTFTCIPLPEEEWNLLLH